MTQSRVHHSPERQCTCERSLAPARLRNTQTHRTHKRQLWDSRMRGEIRHSHASAYALMSICAHSHALTHAPTRTETWMVSMPARLPSSTSVAMRSPMQTICIAGTPSACTISSAPSGFCDTTRRQCSRVRHALATLRANRSTSKRMATTTADTSTAEAESNKQTNGVPPKIKSRQSARPPK